MKLPEGETCSGRVVEGPSPPQWWCCRNGSYNHDRKYEGAKKLNKYQTKEG